jgi:hypothetical protein
MEQVAKAIRCIAHALDPIIEISAQQLTRSEDASPYEPG